MFQGQTTWIARDTFTYIPIRLQNTNSNGDDYSLKYMSLLNCFLQAG